VSSALITPHGRVTLDSTPLGYLAAIFLPRIINPEEVVTLVDNGGAPEDVVHGLVNPFGQYFFLWEGSIRR